MPRASHAVQRAMFDRTKDGRRAVAERAACMRPVGRPACKWLVVLLFCVLLLPEPALAYIGPGAGFAVGTTLVTLFFAVLSALGALVLWPFRWVIRAIRQRRAHAKARIKRVVVLGLDGLDATLTERFLSEGKLPNFAKLKEQGTYRRLATTVPAMTPVAWSSFLTGCNPGKHNIFDFLTRDKKTYLPALSSVQINPPRKTVKLGRFRIPVSKPDIRLQRKGKPFWNTLGEHGIFSNVIRMPITFPPEPFHGVLLSAMCVPDLRGSQGTFSYYSSAGSTEPEYIGGEQIYVKREGNLIRSHLVGPENTFVEGGGAMRCPFEVRITGPDHALLKVNGETHKLTRGEYTPWITVKFKPGLGVKVNGICEVLLLETEPEFRMYVTPIQIDPARPAMAISHPKVYATYLSKLMGQFATMGLAEDTWGMNARILDDEAFLHQCVEADEERIDMFFDALEKVRRGLCVCVVDGPDRIHHMFWRYLEPEHPGYSGQGGRERRNAIEEMYVRMDELVGDTLAACADPGTLLWVISDHGCASFRRGIDLNVWLEQNGYLKLKPDGRGQRYLTGVDWSQTRAYCIGLTGIWLNIRGREAQGIVDPKDAAALRDELVGKLTGLRDAQDGQVAINRVFDAQKVYRGPYKSEAPDLIIGYNAGYRVSWEAAIGQPTDRLFHENTKAWSGDHIIDPKLVPGVLFSNRKIADEQPHIADLGPTVLELFGVAVPEHMDGRPLRVADADGSYPDGNHGQERAAAQAVSEAAA